MFTLFKRKINHYRPSNDCPSAYAALKKGLDLVKIIDSAKPIRHESITSFYQLRQEVFTELSEVELVAGVKVYRIYERLFAIVPKNLYVHFSGKDIRN